MAGDNIVFIGFMCSGKTTAGKALAKEKGWPFLDTDELIEVEAGMTISEIFETHGEEYFRDLESRICETLRSYSQTIIATGGGIVLRESNREILKQLGEIRYLQVTTDQVLERLKNEPEQRPLLKRDNLEEYISSSLNKRQKYYKLVHRR